MNLFDLAEQAIPNLPNLRFIKEENIGESDLGYPCYYEVKTHPMCGYDDMYDFYEFDATISNIPGSKTIKLEMVTKNYHGDMPKYLSRLLEIGNEEWENIDPMGDLDYENGECDESTYVFESTNMEDIIKKLDELLDVNE